MLSTSSVSVLESVFLIALEFTLLMVTYFHVQYMVLKYCRNIFKKSNEEEIALRDDTDTLQDNKSHQGERDIKNSIFDTSSPQTATMIILTIKDQNWHPVSWPRC